VIAHLFPGNDLVQVVLDDGVGEACREVLDARTPVHPVHEVRLDEHRAPVAEAAGRAGAEGLVGELLFYPDAEPLGLLLEERARPGGAGPCSYSKSTTAPSRRLMNFESCPPISKIVSTFGIDGGCGRRLRGDLVS